MNINIYFLSKNIIITDELQNSENQLVIDFDKEDKMSIQRYFENFINQERQKQLVFTTTLVERAFDNFKKLFKVIYAAGGLIEKDGKFLFIFRLKKWDLPKGKIDPGESPQEAAIRECEEECGITQLQIIRELNSSYHIYPYKGAMALKKTYWYHMSTLHEGTLTPQLEENIEAVEWFNENDIQKKVVNNTYPAILDVVSEIF